MKPAFSYYGGKQRLATKIVPLLPKHTVYVEPFAGGLAVFFAKPRPAARNSNHYREVINDVDGRVVNFYRQLRDNPAKLVNACKLTPYSREEYELAKQPTDDPLEAARRWFVTINKSFANKAGCSWGTSITSENHPITFAHQAARLGACAQRFAMVYVEHDDALAVIKRWDSPQTLFYCDPPYVGAHQGHYRGYTQADFDNLVTALTQAQGSFVLSCYGFDAPAHWECFKFEAHCSAAGTVGASRDKTQTATALGDRKRIEYVYRLVRTANVRPEIQRLYARGLYDCFQGG